jgi:hypothetical protein
MHKLIGSDFKNINSNSNKPTGDSIMDTFRCSINNRIINKDTDALKKHNSNFQEAELNIQELLESVYQGKAFSPIVFKDNTRIGANFISSQLLVLDFDKSNLIETLNHEVA